MSRNCCTLTSNPANFYNLRSQFPRIVNEQSFVVTIVNIDFRCCWRWSFDCPNCLQCTLSIPSNAKWWLTLPLFIFYGLNLTKGKHVSSRFKTNTTLLFISSVITCQSKMMWFFLVNLGKCVSWRAVRENTIMYVFTPRNDKLFELTRIRSIECPQELWLVDETLDRAVDNKHQQIVAKRRSRWLTNGKI